MPSNSLSEATPRIDSAQFDIKAVSSDGLFCSRNGGFAGKIIASLKPGIVLSITCPADYTPVSLRDYLQSAASYMRKTQPGIYLDTQQTSETTLAVRLRPSGQPKTTPKVAVEVVDPNDPTTFDG